MTDIKKGFVETTTGNKNVGMGGIKSELNKLVRMQT